MPVGEKDKVGKPGPLPGGSPGAVEDNSPKAAGVTVESNTIAPPQSPGIQMPSEGGQTAGSKQHQRDVDYTLEFVDDLPGQPLSGGGGKPSVFEDRIDEIKGDESKWRKWARLASYRNASAAAAAANVLRQRHGLPYVEGLTMETRKVQGENGESRTLLFTRYDPERIEEGGKEKWEKAEADRKARNEARRLEREAATAKAQPQPATTPQPQPVA